MSAPWPETIVDAARQAAERWPDAPALIEGERALTFADLWRQALAAASAMLVSGIAPGDRIALWAPNLGEWILAGLGAQICGGVLIPLNTRYRGYEAAQILRRTRAKLLVTVRDFLGTDYRDLIVDEALPDLAETIAIEDWPAFVARGNGADDPAALAAALARRGDELSDIIFTSGTTGEPKGVMTAHEQVTHIFWDWADRTDLREGDRHLIVNPFSHTFGYKAGWVACLMRGATIIPQPVFDEAEIARLIRRHGVTFIPGPPAIYQSLLIAKGASGEDFPSLRVAVTGGAPVPEILIERMRSELGMRRVVNGYGMTEHGTISMTSKEDPDAIVATTCGRPLPGVEVRCVDDAGNDMPAGQPGEFLIRSHAVMRGYLDDPAATWAAVDAEGWLHSGDIGTIDAAGYLRITDRKKDMFISGGFNCYPAEIEAMLSRHPAIEMAAVVGVPDERMGEVGRAFVTLRPGTSATPDELRVWARGFMANYKVPRSIEILDALPRNAANKVLRVALRERALGGA